MIEKNPKVKKFDLEFVRSYDGYTTYRVVGLTTAYYGSGDTDYANGACGLIKQKNHPGYCQLCFVYHTEDSDHYGNNGCTVEFMPLITKDGERILVKYEHDSLLCTFERGHKDYDKWMDTNEEVWKDGTITFLDNGYCDIWDEDEMTDKEKDIYQTCEHYWTDFPMPLDEVISHCEVLDDKSYRSNMDDVVAYPCLVCPFGSYSPKK